MPQPTTAPLHPSPTPHVHNPPPTPHVTETPPTPPHGTHPSTSTSSSVKQAPTTNVSKASPTTGISTTPPELCPNGEEEYPLKSNNKKSRRFRRYNHNNQHKQKLSRIEDNDHCVNLSSCTLTKEETSVLNKGLGFVPTPPLPHPSAIQKDINKFARTLRLKVEFQQNSRKKRKFRLQSNYMPPLSANNCLEDYIYALKIEATKLKPCKTRNNLSQRRQIALKKLRKRKDIIIKKADKGSTVVIQDKQEYIETGLEHLSDKDTYNELQEDQTKQVAEEVTQAVRAMYQEGHIDKPTAEYLLPPQMVRTQEMYFQKKIHKNPPSTRPIVSGCNGPTEKISAYLDHWLQPLAKSLPSYIKDTKEFVKYIESTKLPKDCILCTLDVSSLYTNIPTEDGIHAALQANENWKNKDPTCPPTSWLKKLLELILYKNVFRFNDKFYIQKQGTAMGTKMAPAYANIFMGTLESRILSQTNPSPIHWKRYIDDIFLVWTDTKESLEQFIKSINDLHPHINFTAEFSTDEIIFLDLCLYKGERFAKEGILDIKTHIKPTNTQQYVHASSAHPPGTGRGIIKGELLRYLRTNSNEATFQTYKEKHVQNMKKEVIDKKS